jgi:hypothetical protein
MQRITGLALLVGILAGMAGCSKDELVGPSVDEPASMMEKSEMGNGELRVMTWNIYVGANVDVVLEATNVEEAAQKVAVAYEELKATNFPERAKAIAAQVARHRPQLIGLQEVSLIQRLDPETGELLEEIDFLQILKDALRQRGLRYRVAGSVENADVTVPRLIGIENGNPVIDYVRLLDTDVILVSEDVAVSGSTSGRYAAALPVPDLGAEIPRGYASIVAQVGARKVRFVTTHLESAFEEVRFPQAQELAEILAGETLPTIVLGDFNTLDPAPPNPANDGTYRLLTGDAGFADAWVLRKGNPNDIGFTSPHESDLRNPVADLYERIDLVLLKNFPRNGERFSPGSVHAEVIGEEEADRTASGMWPSDHAGLVVKLNGKVPL